MSMKAVLIVVIMLNVFFVGVVVSHDNNDNEDTSHNVEFLIPLKHAAESFFEIFDQSWEERWFHSAAMKDGVDADIARYDGVFSVESHTTPAFTNDNALTIKSVGHHYAVSSSLPKTFSFNNMNEKPFIAQYEVRLQSGLTCGGAYIKLLSEPNDLQQFSSSSPYTIMFGPDTCGSTNKVHLIFRHKNPVSGETTEHHLKNSPRFDAKSLISQLFTLSVFSDGTFNIRVDDAIVASGSLNEIESFEPHFQPNEEIDDLTDSKPEDWVDLEKIPDHSAVKPDDWDESEPKTIIDKNAKRPDSWLPNEPEEIPDPDAMRPVDWDDEEDGEWIAPLVPNPLCEEVGCGEWSAPVIMNPKYKGLWSAPMIDNPLYKGLWSPRKIRNPSFFKLTNPLEGLAPISALGFELWTMSADISFDNILVTQDVTESQLMANHWAEKVALERQLLGVPETNDGPMIDTLSEVVLVFTSFVQDNVIVAVLILVFFVLFSSFVLRCLFSGSTPQPIVKDDDPKITELDDVSDSEDHAKDDNATAKGAGEIKLRKRKKATKE